MKAQYEEDVESLDNEIRLSTYADMVRFTKAQEAGSPDEFKISAEEMQKMSGMSPAFRRKLSRELSKAFTGKDGAETQQSLLAQAITGYAFLDVIEPVYNLEYLSRLYEISTYNYAACNAKTSNIVGLGYQFLETRKTNDALDGISDDKQLERARKKLNRIIIDNQTGKIKQIEKE